MGGSIRIGFSFGRSSGMLLPENLILLPSTTTHQYTVTGIRRQLALPLAAWLGGESERAQRQMGFPLVENGIGASVPFLCNSRVYFECNW